MSAWISCPICGKPKEVPAYPGDGVYSRHNCDRADTYLNDYSFAAQLSEIEELDKE